MTDEIVLPDDLDELPSLDTEEERDTWAEVLLQQTDETLEMAGQGWIKALCVRDDEPDSPGYGSMVIRLIYAEGVEEILDVTVNRVIMDIDVSEESERN